MSDWDAKRGCFDWQQSVNQSGGAFSQALVSYLDCSHSNPSSQQSVHSLSLQKSGFLPNLKILKVVDILRSQAWLVKPANRGGFSVVSVERKRGHHNINFKFKRQLLRAVIVSRQKIVRYCDCTRCHEPTQHQCSSSGHFLHSFSNLSFW